MKAPDPPRCPADPDNHELADGRVVRRTFCPLVAVLVNRHVSSMALHEALLRQMLETHAPSESTTDALQRLGIRLGMFFASGTAHDLMTQSRQNGDGIWDTYVNPEGTPQGNVRIATLDLGSVVGDGPPEYLKTTDQDARKAGDGGGKPLHSAQPPVLKFNLAVRRDMIAYLQAVLKNELAGPVATAFAAIEDEPAYRAIVSIDFYADRSIDTHSLHKDTTGITLFVALHYMNPEPMLGPEYIHDKWPLQSQDGSKYYFVPVKADPPRWHAPWTKHQAYYYWPKSLLEQLELARAQTADDQTIHHCSLTRYGLISFVDELLYHATPLRASRTPQDKEVLFKDVNVSRLNFSLVPPELKRTVSFRLSEGETLPSYTGGAAKRCFMRLWISIAHKSWYAPLDV